MILCGKSSWRYPLSFDDRTKYLSTPRPVCCRRSGRDSGLTGRKVIVDTYGGMGRHGGGPVRRITKVDRSATYAARYVAKNIVAAKLARRCEVQVAYAIGVARPVSLMVDTFGTGKTMSSPLGSEVSTWAAAIIRYGSSPAHLPASCSLRSFRRDDLDLPWEKTDKVDARWQRPVAVN